MSFTKHLTTTVRSLFLIFLWINRFCQNVCFTLSATNNRVYRSTWVNPLAGNCDMRYQLLAANGTMRQILLRKYGDIHVQIIFNANNVAERVRKMSIRFSLFVHTHNVLTLSWDKISGGTRGPVTSVSLHLVILMEIISIKTYSPMGKKIVNTCSHSNITVWVYILNIVEKSPTSPRHAIFSIYVGHHHWYCPVQPS